MARRYRIEVERTIVQTRTMYVRANNKGVAVAIALSEGAASPNSTDWREVEDERSPVILARKR